MDSLQLVKAKIDELSATDNGISLLTMKNEALLSYINNLVLIVGSQIAANESVRQRAIKGTVEQRVTIEKGVKGLEQKISYQIDKAVRAFKRQQEQEQAKVENNSESDSSDEEDLTAYRPNVAQLKAQDDESSDEEDRNKKYTAPKIAKTALAAPTQERRTHKRRDFAMEEYLREQDTAPIAEPSIGAAIMDSGRGGQSTEQDRRKEREIQEYEEANFTRIGTTSGKKLRKEAAKRQRDAFSRQAFGENWDFLDRKEKGPQKKKGRRH